MSLKKRKVSSTFDSMQQQEYLYKGPNHAANLNDMRLKDKYCDVTIKVNGKEFRAHKVILAANLKYFETMFSSDSFQESHDGVITMKSVEKAHLELFVSYAYTGEILLTQDNALNVLELANYLSEDGIKEACVEFLGQQLKAEDACRAYKFANTIECLSLKNAAKAKIIANFDECSKSADYLNVDFESLMDMLSDGESQLYQVRNELFEGMLRWIMHDAKERKICLEDLLNCIDITELKSDDVMCCLYENVVHYNDEYGVTKDTIKYYKAKQIERNKGVEVLLTMNHAGSYQLYNFIQKKWTPMLQVPGVDGFIYCHNAVSDGKIYYITIVSGKPHLRVFDPSSIEMTSLNSSTNILKRANLCACNGFLYICGGIKTDESISDQTLRYNLQTNSIEKLASMGTARRDAAGIFYQGCLHVLGGYDGSSYLQSVEKYDPTRNEWTNLAPMCKKRCWHALAVLDGKLYACGGLSDTTEGSSVEVYDPATHSWQLIACMNKARIFFFTVPHEGKLLAIGGAGQMTVEVYDPSKNQWQMDEEMSSGLLIDCRVGGLIPSSCITDT